MQLVKNTTGDIANCISGLFLVLFLIKKVTEVLVKQIGLKTCSGFIKTFTDPSGVLGCPVQYRHRVTGLRTAQDQKHP